jgi:redox-sensing transcriptional repressor
VERVGAAGRPTISSRELGNALDLTDAQVRKDLAYFGTFGHPGVGYRVGELVRQLKQVLGTDRSWPVALIGAGNLGRALASHPGFTARGFALIAIFDAAAAGETLEALPVQPMDALVETVKREKIRLAILAVPAEAAQGVADQLVEAGIHGILNFAPVTLDVPDHVSVNAVDLAAQLEQLAFAIRDGDAEATTKRPVK